jgi:uncharacterized protein DUF2793
MATANLSLPYITAAQAQKHVTHNAALDLLDALVPAVVVSATETTAPGSPADGESYIVPSGGTFGTVAVGNLAVWSGGVWNDIPAVFGHRLMVLDEGQDRVYCGSAGWKAGSVAGEYGSTLGVLSKDATATLDAGAQVSLSALIPTRAIVLGVSVRVETAITGPAAFKVGISGDLAKFGGSLGLSAGSTNLGVVGPYATYSSSDVLITAQDEATAFTAGEVRVAAMLLIPSTPDL